MVIENPAAGSPQQSPEVPEVGGMFCIRWRKPGRVKSTQLEEKWWLEYDPPKANYISGKGRGPFGGNSINKADWPRQVVPIRYKQRWEKRERLRHAFQKNGFDLDVPEWGG